MRQSFTDENHNSANKGVNHLKQEAKLLWFVWFIP